MRYLEMRGRASAAEMSKALKVRIHTVHYTLSRLLNEGILRRRVVINHYRLGLTRLAVYLSLPAMSDAAYTAFIKKLCASERVGLVLELGGAFHLAVSLIGTDVAQLREHMDWLVECAGVSWLAKSVTTPIQHTIYGTKVLGSGKVRLPPFGYQADVAQVRIDQLDHQILCALMSESPLSMRDIARDLSVPPSTVEYRIKKLEENGIIAGYTFLIEQSDLLHYVLLVHAKMLGPPQRAEFSKFARAHTNAFYTVESIGSWDFELGLVVKEPKDVIRATRDLYQAMGEDIARTEALSLIARHKVIDYPLQKFGTMDKVGRVKEN
jgi:DNA-binding Lrp family transcriptional regulator